MKTIIFGGTFDPIHLGHLYLLHAIASLSDYERIIVIPTYDPPHKIYDKQISDTDRLELLYRGVEDYRVLYPEDRPIEIIIDSVEIDRGGKSYMYDTVLNLYTRYQITGKIAVAIGDDLLPTISSWYRAEELFQLVYFIIVNRLEKSKIELPKTLQGEYIEVEPFLCSSTIIREMLGNAKSSLHSLSFLLSESVLDYIIDYDLYQRH